jgi:hypothetical protein
VEGESHSEEATRKDTRLVFESNVKMKKAYRSLEYEREKEMSGLLQKGVEVYKS